MFGALTTKPLITQFEFLSGALQRSRYCLILLKLKYFKDIWHAILLDRSDFILSRRSFDLDQMASLRPWLLLPVEQRILEYLQVLSVFLICHAKGNRHFQRFLFNAFIVTCS